MSTWFEGDVEWRTANRISIYSYFDRMGANELLYKRNGDASMLGVHGMNLHTN
jgi:hypothetical protein